VAEAEARALEMLRGTIGEKGDATGYLIAIKYLEALREISVGTNSKVVFMPFEATGVLGSLGSMRELLRDAPDSSARKKAVETAQGAQS
jgi:regulator of protease activity HflC (stomatin/prohibitin superfamily)